MKLEADSRIAFPRALVFSTYRDRLPELVPHLPNIKAIKVEKREDGPALGAGEAVPPADASRSLPPGVSKLVNLWEGKSEVPKVAQSIIKPEMIAWIDYATWNENDWTVEWRIETKLFTENIKCGGKNRYLEQGNDTILEIRGNLDIDLKGIPGVPRLLAGTIAPAVEKFVIAMLTPNLTSVAKGLEAFLQAEAKK